MALILAMSAQSISHLIEQTYMEGSALLTVAVSCIPPLVIGHLIHMAETPSQAVSASEEMEELKEMNQGLMTSLVAVESAGPDLSCRRDPGGAGESHRGRGRAVRRDRGVDGGA
ncbi:hypothetical protein GCM10023238_05160 [Streptomyces heliomycini]